MAFGLLDSAWITGILALTLLLLIYTLYNRIRRGLAEAADNT